MADVNKTVQINIKGDASKLNKSLSGAKAGFVNLAKGIAAGSAAVAALAAGFAKLNQAVADMVNELVDASTKTGIQVENLQALKLAAEGSGKSFASIEGGLIRFQQSMQMAAEGTGKQAEAFDKLGVSVTNTDGSMRSSNEVFEEAIQKLREMGAGTERNITTMDLFGRSAGSSLTQSGAIDSLSIYLEKVESFGLDVGPKAREEAARWQRAMADLGMVTRRAGQDMSKALSGKGSPAAALEHLGGALVFLKSIAVDVFSFIANLVRTAFGAIQSVVHTIMSMDFGKLGKKLNDVLMVKNLSDIPKAWNALDKHVQGVSEKMLKLNEPNALAFDKSISNLGNTFANATSQYQKFMSMSNLSAEVVSGQAGRGGRGGRGGSSGGGGNQISEKEKLLALEKEVLAITSKSNEKILSQSEKIKKEYGEQIERLKQIQQISKDKVNTEEAQFEIKKDMEKQLADIREKNSKKLAELEEKRLEKEGKDFEESIRKRIAMVDSFGKALTGYFSSFGNAIQTTMENQGTLTETHARRLHRLQQGAGVGEVLINAAVATMKAYAQFGPIGGALAAIPMTALAGIQTAAIMSQPPPKFHTGGLVDGADVVNAQLLRGEAVLDRKTVRKIGGERGLDNVGSPPQVIVMNSFKHFDRYLASSMRGNSRIRKLVPSTNGRRI